MDNRALQELVELRTQIGFYKDLAANRALLQDLISADVLLVGEAKYQMRDYLSDAELEQYNQLKRAALAQLDAYQEPDPPEVPGQQDWQTLKKALNEDPALKEAEPSRAMDAGKATMESIKKRAAKPRTDASEVAKRAIEEAEAAPAIDPNGLPSFQLDEKASASAADLEAVKSAQDIFFGGRAGA